MIRSQHLQTVRGRTMRFTMKRSGIYSSSSVTSSPRLRRSPPHLHVSPGLRTCSLRGSVGGNGLRFGFCFSSGSGTSSGGAFHAAAVSSSWARPWACCRSYSVCVWGGVCGWVWVWVCVSTASGKHAHARTPTHTHTHTHTHAHTPARHRPPRHCLTDPSALTP